MALKTRDFDREDFEGEDMAIHSYARAARQSAALYLRNETAFVKFLPAGAAPPNARN
jgi:hypothetical protein